MPRPLEHATVAITGASSGIGRATALRLARRGANLALCARAAEPLEDVGRECEALGAAVLTRTLDVAEEAEVERFAADTAERFGRLDVWVNNAGVIAYGEFLDIPPEVFRGVIETNLMGQVHGARAALRHFAAQEEGVLINVSSVWGRVPSPQVSPYIVSKNAVRAFSECLRSELVKGGRIHVATITPESVDTPIFENGGNYTGHELRPIPPILTAETIAAVIEACAENPKEEVSFGRAGKALELLYVLAPPLYRRIAHRAFVRGTMPPHTMAASSGNVLAPRGPNRVEGGWRRHRRRALAGAFLDAGLGAVAGLLGADARAPKPPRD